MTLLVAVVVFAKGSDPLTRVGYSIDTSGEERHTVVDLEPFEEYTLCATCPTSERFPLADGYGSIDFVTRGPGDLWLTITSEYQAPGPVGGISWQLQSGALEIGIGNGP